ncbi:hypothetical protein [Methylovirgula sp. HY1]|uniref:hypothetical protein n=1 Tax=Methylovirgula sp. HY1 TaxID=2822761 RepID=UPI001C755361|nr:hypothetical protein [Methylovirgula sp. HY1]QXX75855.1 hypothetical protein MHY1_02687 [Methylovirgula sp. HY1]
MSTASSFKFARSPRSKAASLRRNAGAWAALACAAGFSLLQGTSVDAAAATAWPDTYQARLAIWALIETLNADLLASHSATQTLTEWCAAHDMAKDPKIFAHLQRIAKPITPEQRRQLEIGPNEPVIYRRVDLTCGTHVLSQADNWYVPSRLTPEMNAALTETKAPFGRVVRPLHIRRRTMAVKILWRPLPNNWEMAPPQGDHPRHPLVIPALLFEHRALVYAADGKPISEVDETYRSDILDFRR